jgi:uncharacterized protein YfiM (DUF2279 family)
MRFVIKLVIVLAIAVPLAAAWALYMAIDLEPTVRRAAEITPSNIERAKLVLEQNDPRKLRTGTRRSVTLNQQDLDVAANYLAHFYANGSARLILNNRKAELAASLRPPQIPVIFYFNVMAKLTGDSPIPRIGELRVGRLLIPGFIANWFMTRTMVQLLGKEAVDAAVQTVKQVDLKQGQLTVAYEWSANLPETLRSAAFTPDDQERLRTYQERLTLISSAPQTKNVSLAELLVVLFELAEVRSRQGSPVAENRAAILVLALYVNDKPLGTILPAANNWPRPTRQTVTLNGRDDFSKHFIISAALAAKAGGPLSDAVGLYKEIEDSRRGSGFSFNDIAADRAGTRFGEYAANPASAQKLQRQLSAGIGEKDLMPATQDLPEFMPEREFIRRFGGVDGREYKKMMAGIERRVAALPLYR